MWFPDRAHPSLARRITVNLAVGVALTLFVSFFVFHAILRNEMYARVEEALALRVQSLIEYAAANPGRESEVELLTELVHAAGEKLKLSCKTQLVDGGVQEMSAKPGAPLAINNVGAPSVCTA